MSRRKRYVIFHNYYYRPPDETPGKEPTFVCPYTGNPLTLVKNERTGDWRAVGDFYFTRWFPFKRELYHALLTLNGNEPQWAARETVSLSDPEDQRARDQAMAPVADLVERDKAVQDKVDEIFSHA